jgi:4-hydroxy-3-methylbut-2-enyl diphosphate reductase
MRIHFHLNEDTIGERFADTRDTLCYATNDNQSAVYGLLKQAADLAIVVGGYNSSNTSHLVELCEEKLLTYFIDGDQRLISHSTIVHHNLHTKENISSADFLPNKNPIKILLTSGASCPDTMVENVIAKLISFYASSRSMEDVKKEFDI